MLERIGIEHPIIQAPMAGVTTPEFVAACADAGILGAVGAGYLSADETRKFIREVKKRTGKPFMVNLFVPEENRINVEMIQQANDDLRGIRKALGISEPKIDFEPSGFDEQIEVVIEEGVKICSFTFGLPNRQVIDKLKKENVYLVATATTKEEALLAEVIGMDAVVAQGSEAGGHRGSFSGELTFIPLEELLRDILKSVRIPVIAAGGIATKKMADNALAAGAEAVQIGTALLASEESGAHPLHKKEILRAAAGNTLLTKVFSGKVARGLHNEFIERMRDATVAPYPYQNELTKDIRKEAARQGKTNYMSLWAGERAHLSTGGKVREIIASFI